MSIDLTKLIARKSYFIPTKVSQLCKEVLAQLIVDDSSWHIETEHPKSAIFSPIWKTKFCLSSLDQEGKPPNAENIAAKEKEYNSDRFGCYKILLEALMDNIPINLRYVVQEERTDGCIIKVSCRPVLYYTAAKGFAHGNADLQDVKLQGEEFLDEIFIGGLGGKEIQEVKEVSRWEFLINDTHTRQITERIYDMLSRATTCVLFFGWFGTELIPKLKELKEAGLTVKTITHKPAERKAPAPEEIQKGYAELIKLLGLDNVSVNSLLHGRAVIVDNKALVGSMDLNAFSLSGEHIEFAIYTEDPSTVRSLRAYFEKLFKPLKESSS